MRLHSTTSIRLFLTCVVVAALAGRSPADEPDKDAAKSFHTDTPIKHLVVIFQENVSFDHYFATYPHALNTAPGEPKFIAKPGTPSVNSLESGGLLTQNPNKRQPFRLGRAGAITGDMDHGYKDEQLMFDGGLMDHFVQANNVKPDPSVVMAYFDGNTVTAIWNYAQHFAMSDNAFCTGFGPSTPGVLNLVSGQTNGAVPGVLGGALGTDVVDDGHGGLTVVDDGQPDGDIADTRERFSMTGKNIGNLLSAKKITWGWFQGGFCAQIDPVTGKRTFVAPGPKHLAPNHPLTDLKTDYIPHHAGFQYYPSTANPKHVVAASVDEVGHNGPANHNYDLIDFWAALEDHNLPAVSFVKAAGFQDGHAGYSDPLSEQTFLVETINKLQQSPEWKSMAIILTYDDSDGWYDHQMGPIVSQSKSSQDALLGPGNSGDPTIQNPAAFQGRCGYGCRIPFLVISPFARKNWVGHNIIDQSSIIRFVEDNWDLPGIGDQSFDAIAGSIHHMFDFEHGPHPHRLILDPASGQPVGP